MNQLTIFLGSGKWSCWEKVIALNKERGYCHGCKSFVFRTPVECICEKENSMTDDQSTDTPPPAPQSQEPPKPVLRPQLVTTGAEPPPNRKVTIVRGDTSK